MLGRCLQYQLLCCCRLQEYPRRKKRRLVGVGVKSEKHPARNESSIHQLKKLFPYLKNHEYNTMHRQQHKYIIPTLKNSFRILIHVKENCCMFILLLETSGRSHTRATSLLFSSKKKASVSVLLMLGGSSSSSCSRQSRTCRRTGGRWTLFWSVRYVPRVLSFSFDI